jgi:hypothetical protein
MTKRAQRKLEKESVRHELGAAFDSLKGGTKTQRARRALKQIQDRGIATKTWQPRKCVCGSASASRMPAPFARCARTVRANHHEKGRCCIVLWTDCGRDVPADAAYLPGDDDAVTCPVCMAVAGAA